MSVSEEYFQGRATILVSFHNSDKNEIMDFYNYLEKNKFRLCFDKKDVKDYLETFKFLWININSKRIHHGLIGCQLCEPLGNHAVTIDEFKTIYEIFIKYQNKNDILSF